MVSDSEDDVIGVPPIASRQRHRLRCYLALIAADVFAVFAGFGLTGYLIDGASGFHDGMAAGKLLTPIYLMITFYNGTYGTSSLQDQWAGLFRGLTTMVISVVVVVFMQFLIRTDADVSRWGINGGAIAAMLFMVMARWQLHGLVRRLCGENVLNEMIIDDGGPHVELRGAIRVSAAAMRLNPGLSDPHELDRFGLVLRNVDRVIVSCPAARRAEWAMMLKGANIEGEVLDDEVARLGAKGARVSGRHGLLLVSAGPLGLRERALKRLFDVAFAGGAILALSPLLMVVAVAVKLQDGGPVFFVQRRMGRGNRFFNMYKFRSMTQTAVGVDGTLSASRDDKRITPVGKVIRKTSIDELPQLLNVLLGSMSLVGPRPHATGSLAGNKLFWEVDARYWQRHSLKPGLSGLAQVRGFRGATDHESDLVNRLQADLEYLEGWSIRRDLKILFLTVRVLVHHRAF